MLCVRVDLQGVNKNKVLKSRPRRQISMIKRRKGSVWSFAWLISGKDVSMLYMESDYFIDYLLY